MSRVGVRLKQFRSEGCLSYILAEPDSRQAILIDPSYEKLDDVRDFLGSQGLKLALVVDSHLHADHFSASHWFRQAYGALVAMSERSQSARKDRGLKDGESITLGSLSLKVFETPGHTPDSLCLYCPELGVLFTGDTLLIGATGRADFPGSDPGLFWDSLQRLLRELPGGTVVMPGHDYEDRIFSTLEVEKERNPQLRFASREEFIRYKDEEPLPGVHLTAAQAREGHVMLDVRRRLDFNLERDPSEGPAPGESGPALACGVASGSTSRQGAASISVAKYRAKLQEKAKGSLFIDVREPDEFRDGHMPGARNIPLSELALHLPELRAAKRVYVSCLSGFRSGMSAKTLAYAGLPDVVDVTGGFQAWKRAGYPEEN